MSSRRMILGTFFAAALSFAFAHAAHAQNFHVDAATMSAIPEPSHYQLELSDGPHVHPTTRAFLEGTAGLLAGGALFVGAIAVGGDSFLVAAPLALATAPLAIYGVGSLLGGNGSLGATFAGLGIGLAASLGVDLLSLPLLAGSGVAGLESFLMFALISAAVCPVIGAAIGYEISSGEHEREARAFRVAPTFAPTQDMEGAIVGAVGSF